MPLNERLEVGRIETQEHSTYEQAMNTAYAESANTAGWTFPVVIFRQGRRMFLSGAFPMGFVESRLFSRSVGKGSGTQVAAQSMNRPLDSKHTKYIAKYIKENIAQKYIIPPLTLNVQEKVSLHTIKSGPSFKAGYLVIPSGVNLSITDGQHRVKGIIESLDQLAVTDKALADRLRSDSISVMITCEHELRQIHQDFADCSKTKALPASLLSLYDTRNPGNRLVFDLEHHCTLFKGRIDSTSKTLSKGSLHLFLANQLRQLVKHLLFRKNIGDADFEKKANEQLGSDEHYNRHLNTYVDFLNYVTETIPVLKQIEQLPLDSPQKGQIPKIRAAGWICLTATGLNLIGSIGYDLLTYGFDDWKHYVDKFAEIDWSRSGKIWQDNIIEGGRIITTMTPLKNAVKAVEEEIGLHEHVEERKDNLVKNKASVSAN